MKQTLKKLSAFMMAMAISGALFAQVPQKFNYQGIARDTKGNPMAQQRMTLKLTVLPTSDATEGEYEEIQSVTTNEFGLYNLQIGNGTPVKGEMKTVKWETGNKYIKVAIDPIGGNDFVDAGTTQLLSVPYAIYADKAGMAKTTAGSDRAGTVSTSAAGTGTINYLTKFTAANTIYNSQLFDNGTNVGIGTTTPSAKFHINQNVAGVQEHIRMQNLSTTGAGRFTLYSDGATNYSTFTKYGSAFAGSYAGLTGLYPYGNLLAFGNNGVAANDGLGRFLISTAGNAGISIFKGGTSKLKFHADFTSENVGIGGNAAPVSRVHLNNTDGTTMDLRLTNTTTGQTATDGMTIAMTGNSASINNRENASLTLGTNNTTQMTVTAAGNVDFANQIKIAGGAPGVGKVLTSDAAGLATWTTPSISSVGGTTNYIPKYTPNGTTLGNSLLVDSAGLFYNSPYDPSYYLSFNNPNPASFIGNWSQIKGNNDGFTFLFLQDSTYTNKGLVFNRLGSNSFDSIALVYHNPAFNTLSMSNNSIGNGLNLNLTTGDLGNGTTSPTNKFHNVGTLRTDGQMHTNMSSLANSWYQGAFYNPNPAVGSAIILQTADAGNTEFDGAQLSLADGVNPDIELANREAGGIRFFTNGYSEKMQINAAGNVGIGTTTPAARLDVIGNVKITDGTQAAGAILTSDASGNATWNTKAKGTIEQMSSNSVFASAIVNGVSTFISGTRLQVVITSSTQVVHYTGSVTLGSTSVGGAQDLNIYPAYNNTNDPSPVNLMGAGTFGLRCAQNTRQTYTVTGTVTGLAPGTYYFGVAGNSTNAANWNNNEYGYQSIFVLNN
jgi:hypothetical protein